MGTPVFATQSESPVKAELLPSGEVVIRDVPLLSEVRPSDACTQGPNGRSVKDRAYLENALARYKARRVLTNFRPPMNKRHMFDNPERVGVFEPTRVGELIVNPEDVDCPRATIFGDKFWSSLESYQACAGYDYRSPETDGDWPGELAALALLKDKAPMGKYTPLDPGKVPVAPAPEFAVPEMFEARGYDAPQVWRRERAELFQVNAGALSFPATRNKEGDMPAATETKPEKKEPSLEERMEAMAAKCFEGMAKRFETMFGDAMKKKDKAEEAEDKPSTPEGEDVKAKEKKSSGPETAETRSSPDQALPPAVSSSRPGETFQTAVSALSKAERDEYLGMKAYVQKQQKKEQAQTSAAQGEKVLSDAKCPVSEEIRAVLRTEAFESGAAGVKSCVAGILLGFQQRTVGADQILGTGLGFDPGASSEDTGLKAAYEEFGSRPESRLHVERLWQDYRNAPGDFRNKIKFPDLCRASLNPNAPRGGM